MIQNILVGVTGGIAAYKTVTLVRLLQDAGFHVRVVMTKSAQAFVTSLTFQACTAHRVYTDLIDAETHNSMAHIELVRWADLIVVAPATANFMAKCANGFADDLLCTLCLATKVPVFMAPAMNCQMWQHVATQKNIKTLKENHVTLIGPESGELACGDVGLGRMSEPEYIVDVIMLSCQKDLFWSEKKVVITAGPTHEAIDPIRFIGNRSSGKMGYALAKAAQNLGAKVVLITGPTQLDFPRGVRGTAVISAQEMYASVMQHVKNADIFIGAAAVANYHVENYSDHKVKSSNERLQLNLIKNPDIISAVANLPDRPFVVGFAAETSNVLQAAIDKIQRKNLDMIIANQVGRKQGMGVDTNRVTVIDRDENRKSFVEMEKEVLAPLLLEEIKRVIGCMNTITA